MKILLLILLLAVAGPILRILFRLIFWLIARTFFSAWVSKKVLASQPDEIHLNPDPDPAWLLEADVKKRLEPLFARGFTPAGSFTVDELGELPLHFLVHPDKGIMAALYDHPKAGVVLDLAIRFQEGGSFTVSSTAIGGELKQRPGHPTVRMTGASVPAMLARVLRETPEKPRVLIAPPEMPLLFARVYAESMAWRKGKGISAGEIAAVAQASRG